MFEIRNTVITTTTELKISAYVVLVLGKHFKITRSPTAKLHKHLATREK